MTVTSVTEPLRTYWAGLPGREKNGFRLAMLLVLSFLLWHFSVAPGLAALRNADAQAAILSAQFQQMQAMQIQAQAVQKQSPLGFDEAARALTAATQQTLGTNAQLVMAGDRANVTLKGASPDALAQWLAQARLNARSVPVEAKLMRGATPGGTAWSGVLVMAMPAR